MKSVGYMCTVIVAQIGSKTKTSFRKDREARRHNCMLFLKLIQFCPGKIEPQSKGMKNQGLQMDLCTKKALT